MMTYDEVRAYYAALGEREWNRLGHPNDSPVEYAITRHILDRFLPPAARILDIGGGPGRYTIWLAQRGHRLVLADLSPELLAIARCKIAEARIGDRVEAVVEADARDLSRWADASFDAVLALGPFYHLPERRDRERAAAELYRVLCLGGLAFVALIPRYALLRRTIAVPDERHHLAQPDFMARLLEDGVFVNDIPGRFTGAYGVRPDEVVPFFERHGLATLTLVASEGLLTTRQEFLAELAEDPAVYEAVFKILVDTAGDPSILGMASHLVYVGRKEE